MALGGPVNTSAANAGAGSPPSLVVASYPDLGKLRATIRTMSADKAWQLVDAALLASPALPRRHLPGSAPSASVASPASYSRRLAAAAFLVVTHLAATDDSCTAAQILTAFLPRLILRRDSEIPGQVSNLADGIAALPIFGPDRAPRSPEQVWCDRLRRAHLAGDRRRAFELAETGPTTASLLADEARPFLRRLFPHKPDGEVLNEEITWRNLSAPLIAAAPPEVLSQRDILGWARKHKYKAPDPGGWSGQLIVDLYATEPDVLKALSALWSLPACRIVDARARSFMFRTCAGTLIPRPGKPDPRPISAPSVPRKIRSACEARRARAATAPYCEARGQVGLSYGPALQAYAMFPRIVVELGGTTSSTDLVAAYQNFTRSGLLAGAKAFFASEEARLRNPEATTHCARLLDACVFDTPFLQRTTTRFHQFGITEVSHALSQGCSSSPTAQALALAATPLPEHPHSLRKGAHDDAQIYGLPGCTVDSFAPGPARAGASYNITKCIVVGPLGPAIVARGFASKCEPHWTVFGAPVGNVQAWVESMWVPRFRRVIANLRRAFSCDPEAAIAAAHLSGGPGASAAHWLRTCPVTPGTSVWRTLEQMDLEWVHLWISFAGGPWQSHTEAPPLRNDDIVACWNRVFGSGAHCFGHSSATWSSRKHFTAGRSLAWPALVSWANEINLPWIDLARQLGVEPPLLSSPAVTVTSISRFFSAEALKSAASYKKLTEGASEFLRHRSTTPLLGRGAITSLHGCANGHRNLLLASLGGTPSHVLAPGDLAPDGLRDHTGIIIALIFGLPVWGALGIMRPMQCKHCLAPAALPVPASETPASSPLDLRAPLPSRRAELSRRTVDDQGRHLHTCTASGPSAGCRWRHDTVVRALARLSAACGSDGRYHDGPIFTFGPKQRPADLLQRSDNPSRFPFGQAIDVTIGVPDVGSSDTRESDKQQKFASQLSQHPHIEFTAFGITTDGNIGAQAHSLMCSWSRALARFCHTSALPPGNPRSEVLTTVARAFVRSLIFQMVQWKLHNRKSQELGRIRLV